MYQYIYDSFLADNKYFKILSSIENRLTDLGLAGRIDRLTLFKDVRDLIEKAVQRGVKTVVAVGNDATLHQIINAVSDINVAIGLIPVGPQNEVAEVLGIPEGVLACDCLSHRLIQKVDLGKINDYYFLSHVQTSSAELNLKCGGKYCVKSTKNNKIKIYNLPSPDRKANPQDGYLEAQIEPAGRFFKNVARGLGLSAPRQNQASCFPIKKIFLESKKEMQILVDGLKTINAPVEIQILSQRLKIIVGKNRLF